MSNFTPAWFKKGFFNESLFCDDFLSSHQLLYSNGAFFTPDGRMVDPMPLRCEIFEMMREYVGANLAKKVTNVVDVLKLAAQVEDFPPVTDRIALANGTLHLDDTFQEGKPEIVRNRLPVRYDPKAPQPVHWLRFLSDLLYPEDIPTVQEFIGYCLIPSNKGQRMMVIKGSGGEGKSQIGVVLSQLFGCNMKDGSIGKISENRFARADLEHTLLCVDDDMRMEALRQTNYVKSIVTAQGQMDLERKGKQSYQGWMYARLLAFSNGDLQALYDRSDGFYRPQLLLTPKGKPPARGGGPDMPQKRGGGGGGPSWGGFEGLQRLVKNGFQFTESDRAKRNRELVKRDNNNVFDFLESEGYIRLKADACTSSKELYEVYKMWCEENSLNAIKARGFSDALIANQSRYNLESTNNIVNSSGPRSVVLSISIRKTACEPARNSAPYSAKSVQRDVLAQHLPDGLCDAQVGRGIRSGGLHVDDHQIIAPEIPDEPGGGVHHQTGAADDKGIGMADGIHRAGQHLLVQALFVKHHVRLYDAAALGAAGHTGAVCDEIHIVELSAAGAVVAQGAAVQLVHGFAARRLMQAVNVLVTTARSLPCCSSFASRRWPRGFAPLYDQLVAVKR